MSIKPLVGAIGSPADMRALQAAETTLETAAALQSGAGAQALAGGVAELAGQANPVVAKAMQVANQMRNLIDSAPKAAAVAAGAAAGKLAIAEHPLAGQAVNDFATSEPPFMPAAVDPEATPDDDTGGPAPADFVEGTRLLRFYSPLPASKTLLIESMSGSSALSEQYVFQLSLLSKNASIDLKDMMGKNVSIGVQLSDGSEQFINGYVNSFGFSHSDGGFAFYHAEVVPWLTYLKRRVNSRIFQGISVLGVLEKIFKDDYAGLASYELRTSQTYDPENYIVQYDETDENFTCRLMEKYGLFYYFEHSASGHVMVISDDSINSAFCPPQAAHAEIFFNGGNRWHDEDSVTAFAAERSLQSAKVALNTFDFKSPHGQQYVELPTVAEQGDVPCMEVYDGNPAFAYKNRAGGEREGQRRMEVLEWQAKIFSGASDCRGLTAGRSFKLQDHHWFDAADAGDNDFLVLSVQYSARNNYFESGMQDVYRNTFTAIRRKIAYRPRRAHRQPQMPGPQTATVVGPKGTEIHTDKFGRIKVQFHWDRYGRRDERSSCWIRVAQPWAGKDWGSISIPRIGQEVIIDYLEGDPDRPLCTGRLYNGDQGVPYGLPDAGHMMGFKSRSTPGGGGYCEMVIHDQKGKELINIHSQKDMVTTVQATQATIVNGAHQTNSVTTGFHTTTVKQKIEMKSETEHIHLTANTDITLSVGKSKIEMKADGTITISGVHIDVVGSSRIDLNK